MEKETEQGAEVDREESSAEQGSEELPDPDREGPTPETENPATGPSSSQDRSPPPDDLTDDPAYEPEGPVKGIKGG